MKLIALIKMYISALVCVGMICLQFPCFLKGSALHIIANISCLWAILIWLALTIRFAIKS